MKTIIALLTVLLSATLLHAGNGDLIVNGKLGVGTNPVNLFAVNQSANIDYTTASTYGIMLSNQGIRNLSIGSDANYAYIQTWNSKPLYINRVGNKVILYGSVGIGTANPNATLEVNGSISATVKNFDIQDPRYDDPKRRLIHSSLEGPEVGVYYRGEATLAEGRTTVVLPSYFETLTRKENRTVHLTPKFEFETEYICNVAASEVKDGEFTIRAFGVSNPASCAHGVYWEVRAERKDIEKLTVEKNRDNPSEAEAE